VAKYALGPGNFWASSWAKWHFPLRAPPVIKIIFLFIKAFRHLTFWLRLCRAVFSVADYNKKPQPLRGKSWGLVDLIKYPPFPAEGLRDQSELGRFPGLRLPNPHAFPDFFAQWLKEAFSDQHSEKTLLKPDG
jgi:hypothetical protein